MDAHSQPERRFSIVTGFVRRDAYNYYPSDDPFNDLGPANLQRESIAQQRTLLNAGAPCQCHLHQGHSTTSRPAFPTSRHFSTRTTNSGSSIRRSMHPVLNRGGVPVNGFANPAQCAGAGYQPNIAANPNAPNSALYPLFNPVLLPYDLTRGGTSIPVLSGTRM